MARVKLDKKGIGNVLRGGPVRRMVNDAATRIAGAVDADGEPVIMRPYTTDRAAALVIIASRRGIQLQAKNGALTRAAASIGVSVR